MHDLIYLSDTQVFDLCESVQICRIFADFCRNVQIRKKTDTLKNTITRRDRLKSAPYLRLKNIQRTTIGNIWKNYLFSKKFFEFFFRKKYFLESRTMPKNSKRGHSGSLNVFTNRKCKGLPFDRIRKFSKKKSHSAEKTQRGDPLVSPAVLLEA